MQLYEKITSPSGRVTYRLYSPTNIVIPNMEIEAEEAVSILTTLVVSIIQVMEDQLPPSDILHRRIRNTKNELTALAAIGFTKPKDGMVDVGVEAWNAAVNAIQDGLLRVRS
jgi:hypothetical protein